MRKGILDEKAKKGRRSEGLKMSSRKKLARRPKVQNFERVDNIEKAINTISQIFIKLKMLKKKCGNGFSPDFCPNTGGKQHSAGLLIRFGRISRKCEGKPGI